ncbi:MAG: glutamate racemase [Hydrogenibacillus schlegelii]|nr:glutamate racemase [Hydrogenibacillus schlegelii]
MDRPIGILDSGVGGLTVVKEVLRQLPNERIVYIGDSARCPYGSRPREEIVRFTMEMVRFLLKFDPKVLVIACNTATAVALDAVRAAVPVPVIGVIDPGARAAIRETAGSRIGVIGTVQTIESGAYVAAIGRTRPDLTVVGIATPELVPLIELGWPKEAARPVLEASLAPVRAAAVDTLVLGCTHYPLIADWIQDVLGDGVKLISSATETAAELAAVLTEAGLLRRAPKEPVEERLLLFTTGDVPGFQAIAERWLGRAVAVRSAVLNPERV